jgi:phage terminase small subunit
MIVIRIRIGAIDNHSQYDIATHSQKTGVGVGVPPRSRSRIFRPRKKISRGDFGNACLAHDDCRYLLTSGGDRRKYPLMANLSITVPINDYPISKEMSALLPRERAFVFALVESGGNASQAAAAAGYGSESATPAQKKMAATQAGHRLLAKPHVLEAIKSEAGRRLESGALMAASILMEIAQTPGHKYQYKALIEIMNRAGMIVAQKIEVKHEHELNGTDRETIAKITEIASRLGLDPQKLLGRHQPVIDAEFEEVEPEGSLDGLEDLL